MRVIAVATRRTNQAWAQSFSLRTGCLSRVSLRRNDTFMHQHPAFDRYQESYPRRSELHQNYYSRAVMNKVQFLLASEPRKPLKPRSLNVIFLVEKDVRVKRCRACDYHHHKKI
jgi:hypothetical protein